LLVQQTIKLEGKKPSSPQQEDMEEKLQNCNTPIPMPMNQPHVSIPETSQCIKGEEGIPDGHEAKYVA
jgi:hypothetical protein